MPQHLIRYSKFLSLVLRHDPHKIGLSLDPQGWASVDELLEKANRHGVPLDRPTLERVVAENDKQRYALSPDGARIRANQGHSIAVDLALAPQAPPETLYHGTAARFLESIRQHGLRPGSRHHVHLSLDAATALNVGRRHGAPVVLQINSGRMAQVGLLFYRSANGIWLTEHVPPAYIYFAEES